MINKKAVLLNTASQVIVRIITLAFTLVSIKLLTNYLGVVGIGEYNTITTYINFFIVIADLGLFAVTVREISKAPDNEKKIISNVFSVRILSALLACLIAITLVFLSKYRLVPHIFYGVMIAAGFLFFNLLGSVYDMILQYRLKMQYSALAEFLSKLISIVALVLIILAKGNFFAIISTIALSGILIFLFKWSFARSFLKFGIEYDRKMASWIFQSAWPLGIVFIINNLFIHLDALMLYVMKGAAAVGIYTVAYKILDVTAFIGSYFASSLKPALSESIHNDKNAVKRIIERGITILLMIGLPIAAATAVFANEIIQFLSSADFLAGGKALILLGFSLPFLFLDILLAEIYIAADNKRLMIGIFVFVTLFNFLANIFFITYFSFIGAAITTLLSEVVLLVINIHYTKKIVSYSFDEGAILRIVLISIVASLAALALKNLPVHFILLIVIFFLIYAGLALAFKVVSIPLVKEILKERA